MTAVDERQELYALRAALIEEGVQSGPDGAAGVQHVIHKHDVAPGDVEADQMEGLLQPPFPGADALASCPANVAAR